MSHGKVVFRDFSYYFKSVGIVHQNGGGLKKSRYESPNIENITNWIKLSFTSI
jgi:hypothetical protein